MESDKAANTTKWKYILAKAFSQDIFSSCNCLKFSNKINDMEETTPPTPWPFKMWSVYKNKRKTLSNHYFHTRTISRIVSLSHSDVVRRLQHKGSVPKTSAQGLYLNKESFYLFRPYPEREPPRHSRRKYNKRQANVDGKSGHLLA